jgi:hypothetical protein
MYDHKNENPESGVPPSNQPGTSVNPEQFSPDPVIFNTKLKTSSTIIVSILLLPTGLGALVSAIFIDFDFAGGDAAISRITSGIIGTVFLLLWALLFITFVRVRSAFVAIGPMGINRHINSDQWIHWDEISSVGISVLHASPLVRNVGSTIAKSVMPGANVVIRLRIAGSEPGLPHRPDLSMWRTADEPEPYTHKVVLPKSTAVKFERQPSVEQAHEALVRFAGARYTGVEYRQTFTRRYS